MINTLARLSTTWTFDTELLLGRIFTDLSRLRSTRTGLVRQSSPVRVPRSRERSVKIRRQGKSVSNVDGNAWYVNPSDVAALPLGCTADAAAAAAGRGAGARALSTTGRRRCTGRAHASAVVSVFASETRSIGAQHATHVTSMTPGRIGAEPRDRRCRPR